MKEEHPLFFRIEYIKKRMCRKNESKRCAYEKLYASSVPININFECEKRGEEKNVICNNKRMRKLAGAHLLRINSPESI